MKFNFFRFLTILSMAAVMFACGDDEKPDEPAITPKLEISAADKSLAFTVEAGSKTIVVTANADYTVTVETDKSWCTISDKTESLFKVNVTANTANEERTAKVTVSLEGAPSVEITVTQAGVPLPPAALLVSPKMFHFDTPAAGEKKTTVTTNRDAFTVTVETGKTWVTTEIDGNTITIKVEESTVEAEREAKITVHVDGAEDVILHVTQAAYVPPVTAPNATKKWTVAAPGDIEWYKWVENKTVGTPATGAPSVIDGPVTGVKAWTLAKEDHIKVPNPIAQPTTSYTLLWDVRIANYSNYHPLLQTTVDNNDGDGDVFINKSGAVGLSQYSTTTVPQNTWSRIVASVDISAEIVTFYLDGLKILDKPITSDGDKTRYTLSDIFWVFLDDDNEDEAIDCASLAIWNTALSAAEIGSLGNAATAIN
jgi:hypothetical protein